MKLEHGLPFKKVSIFPFQHSTCRQSFPRLPSKFLPCHRSNYYW